MTVIISHEIPFHDIDSLNIVWHGHYYKYFELARTVLYRSLNFDIQDMARMGFAFPVIESHCRYTEVLRYGQKIDISAHFSEWNYYLLINYRINDAESGKRVAYGYTKQAVCDQNGQLQSCVPDAVRDIIEQNATTTPNQSY